MNWVKLNKYNGVYFVSDTGLVKSIDHLVNHSNGRHRIQKGRVLKQHISKKGYSMVSLSFNGKRFHTGVHRLVAYCFLENPESKPQVNHINGIKTDNVVANLEWCTNSENQIHAIRNGLIKHNTCEKHHMSKLSNKDVVKARHLHQIGYSNKELASMFKISSVAMSKILRKLTYINI